MRFFLWLLFDDKLNTNWNRARKQVGVSTICPTCLTHVETAIHLFRDCSFSREVWGFCFALGSPPNVFFVQDLKEWLQQNCTAKNCLHGVIPWPSHFLTIL